MSCVTYPLRLAAIPWGRSPGWNEGGLGATDSGSMPLKGLGAELGTTGRTADVSLAEDNLSYSPLPSPAQMLGHHRYLTIVVDPKDPHPRLHLGKTSSHHSEMGKWRPRLGSQLASGHTGNSKSRSELKPRLPNA